VLPNAQILKARQTENNYCESLSTSEVLYAFSTWHCSSDIHEENIGKEIKLKKKSVFVCVIAL